jgi:xylulokinase
LESGSGTRINELLMYGGSSRSDVWNQIFSDVIGVEVLVPETPETTSLGAAMCAAVGSGIYKSFEEAVKNMVHLRKKYLPNLKAKEVYEKLFERCYLPIYESVRGIILEAKNIVKRCK